jgi:hypothetical protein
MKQFFSTGWQSLLSNFKFYRKQMGGTWYKVADYHGAAGFGGEIIFWTRSPEDCSIIEKEQY